MKAEGVGLRLLGHSDLGGFGDGMQVIREGDALYVGHVGPSGMGTSILDVSDPRAPRLVRQWPAPPGTHTHKVQLAEGMLLVNRERFRSGQGFEWGGFVVYRLDDPFAPEPIGEYRCTGAGVHRMWWTGGRYVVASATPEGFRDRMLVVVDLADPAAPVEVGRWWWPGQWEAGGEAPTWPTGRRFAAHHALVHGSRAYAGWGDAGMVILDLSDPAAPRPVGTLTGLAGGDAHTCLPLPGRRLVVLSQESVHERCQEEERSIFVVDVSREDEPRVLARCPPPEGDYCERGGRFGPHNLHEHRPGSYASEEVVFATYFNAGVRVYDLAEPGRPRELAWWVPEPPPGQEAIQLNDLYVDHEGLLFVTDRVGGGLYVLEPEPRLRERMEEARA
ncbi:MAG TPA: hypothetical protein VNP94_13530 [Actinomycetota bacterium]|nr:hypothetical protein [Actinomycetota bacterium]